MARLIPSYIDDRTPPGERDVYNMLSSGPDDWTIIHSLDLAPWNKGLRTEIDFVVIVPDTGILCIEVKSHNIISFNGKNWEPPEIRRSPFKQASDGRHSFYRRLRDLAPQFRSVPVVHLCIFPNALFNLHPNMSVNPWELMDNRIFRSFKNSKDFCNELKSLIIKNIESDQNLKRLVHSISNEQVEAIIGCCLPVQKYRPDAREEIACRENEINSILLEQQKPILQLAFDNERIVVYGGAGTGKTLIAMELARRKAETGERVALLCFNYMIGEWIKENIIKIHPPLPNLIVGRSIQIMAELAGLKLPENPDNNFWNNILPLELEEKLTDPDLRVIAPFDYLVLDEAQDILTRPDLWHCVLQFINGGLNNGKYALFGDFEHQVLGQHEIVKNELEKIINDAKPVRWRLTENCRNYSIVGETAVQLSGFNERVYSGYMRQGGSVLNYNIYFYNTIEEQACQLVDVLSEAKNQGYKPEEITILSFISPEKCVAINPILNKYKIRPEWQHGKFIHYTSVHAFKGMENKIIILVDVSPTDKEFHRDLFYTGMTRATEMVRVLCNKKSQEILHAWLTKGGLGYD